MVARRFNHYDKGETFTGDSSEITITNHDRHYVRLLRRIEELKSENEALRNALKNSLFWEEAFIRVTDEGEYWIEEDDAGMVMPLARLAGIQNVKKVPPKQEETEDAQKFEQDYIRLVSCLHGVLAGYYLDEGARDRIRNVLVGVGAMRDDDDSQ